jgi:alpha-D-xyloside xylohydrolase
MQKALLLALLIALALSAGLRAQWIPLNPVSSVQKEPAGVLFAMQAGAMRVEVLTGSIIHVVYSPTSSFPKRPDYVITKTAWPAPQWTLASTVTEVTLATARLKVAVSRKDGVISYSDLAGRKLLSEGPKTMTPAKVNGEETYRAEDNISIYGSPEAFYGLGQHQAGVWNYRGESVDVSQDNTSIAVPLLLSSNGYGLFWNNTSRSRFNNRFVHSLYISSEVADTIDYYFLYGPDFDKVVAAYRELSGAAPMFGKWAYGFWQSKNRYRSQEELLGVAHKYRELHIPADNIVQDWFWWNVKGEHVFNQNYSDPKGMIDDLHRNNFHLMISVWPYFDRGSAVYRH